MPHYFNPPLELLSVGRPLVYANYDELIKQMKPDEHLFAFRMRDGYPQAAYIWDASHLSEYRSAQGIDEFYALPKEEWDKRFSYIPERYEQKRPEQKEKMKSKEELFYPDSESQDNDHDIEIATGLFHSVKEFNYVELSPVVGVALVLVSSRSPGYGVYIRWDGEHIAEFRPTFSGILRGLHALRKCIEALENGRDES